MLTHARLNKKDGKTKDRVEGWRKNINSFAGQVKTMQKNMEAIDTGEQNDGGVGEGKRDYFSMLADRMIKDLEITVRVC